ncbi:hypothetical protein DD749_04140 [Helicobacter pylori]|nr:hypothetical protein DD749_04140 [Helicobacter pylori]
MRKQVIFSKKSGLLGGSSWGLRGRIISKYPPIPLKNEFEIFFKRSFKMTKQKKSVLKKF